MIRIMLLDDHQLVREGTKALLELEDDIEVVGESGEAEAFLSSVGIHKPDIAIVDLLIDDHMDGYPLIEHLNAKYPEVSILVVSMFTDKEYVKRAFSAGALGYVPKKEAANSLIKGVRSIYAGEHFISPVITRSLFETINTSDQRPPKSHYALTRREQEIFSLLGLGKTRKEISLLLKIKESTVGTHFENMKDRLNLKNISELVHMAIAQEIGSNHLK